MFDTVLDTLGASWWRRRPLVTVVRLDGPIGRLTPWNGGLTLAGLAPTLKRAFAPKRLAAVALAINSPGGAPAQSALIAGRIQALAKERGVPVLGFCEDVAASGGYWLAIAADEIYADRTSIIGSIGVVSQGFGLHDFIKRFGIERRVHTAGERKFALDPFAPERAEEVAHLKAIQAEMHEAFKAEVRARRGTRLKGAEAEIFSGAFWAGGTAVSLGLIDGLGDLRGTLRARFGERVRLQVIGQRRPWWRRAPLGDSLVGATMAALEERALWARYGM